MRRNSVYSDMQIIGWGFVVNIAKKEAYDS